MDIMEMGASDELVSKWGPALDGIENDYTKRVTAQLLENQLKSCQQERLDEAAVGAGMQVGSIPLRLPWPLEERGEHRRCWSYTQVKGAIWAWKKST